MIVAADNEIAGVDRNGAVADQFDALGDYWDGYVNSRVLAYLGGSRSRVPTLSARAACADGDRRRSR